MGRAMPPEKIQISILPIPGARQPYHTMQRMLERHITHDSVQGYVENAHTYFEQRNGRRMYLSDAGVTVVKQYVNEWIPITTWGKADYDEDLDFKLRVVKKYAK